MSTAGSRTIQAFLLVLFLAAVSIVRTGASVAEAPAAPHAPLHIGVILPLTGDIASIGIAVRNGIELALAELPAEQRAALRVSYEDDGFVGQRTVAAFHKLAASGELDAVITAGSTSGNVLAPIVERQKIPQIAIATDTRISKGRRYSVNFWVTPRDEVAVLMPELERRGMKKMARVGTTHDFTTAVKAALDSYPNQVITFIEDEELAPDVKDFKSYIARLKDKRLDGIFVTLMPGQVGLFAKQVRESGLKLPLVSVELFEEPGEVKVSQGALVGQLYANAALPSSRFLEKYRERFPNDSTFAASNGHDAILLLAAASTASRGSAGSSRSEAVNDYLHGVKDFSGSMGRFSALPDNTFSLSAMLKVVTESGFEPLQQPGS